MAVAGFSVVEAARRWGTGIGGVAIAEDLAVIQEDPIAFAGGTGDGRGNRAASGSAEVWGVTKGIDPPLSR